MTTLNAPDPEDSRRFNRTLDRTECLQAGIMSPTAGSRPVKLCSLQDVEEFLSPLPDPRSAATDMKRKVNYVEPRTLVTWVRDVVGDAELADRMGEVLNGEPSYAAVVPAMKRLLSDRIAQYGLVSQETP